VTDTNYSIAFGCVFVGLSANKDPVAVLLVGYEQNWMRTLKDVRANVRLQVVRREAAHRAF
jgi:hypothetical protein